MLAILRRQSSLAYLIFGAIIVIFAINFGPASSGCVDGGPSIPYAAQVNGEMVRYHQFAMAYERQMASMRQMAEQSGMNFTDEMAERFGIRRQVLDYLVEQKLLSQLASQSGMEIPDGDLVLYLQDRYGVKDVGYQTYETWVDRTFGQTVPKFEADVRSELAGQRMMTLVRESITISEQEAKLRYGNEHNRMKVQFVRFEANPATLTAPDANALQQLLQQHPEEIRQHYEQDVTGYRTSHQVVTRQIVKKVPADASAEQTNQVMAQMQALLQQLQAGGDFAQLASQHSEHASAAQGGLLGPITRGQLVKPLEDALFVLAKGQMTTAPVRSPEGFHILFAEDVILPTKKSFEEVGLEVAGQWWKQGQAKEQAQKQAESLLQQLHRGASWAALTQAEDQTGSSRQDLIRRQTDWIAADGENVPRIGGDRALVQRLFQLPQKETLLPTVQEIDGSWYVVGIAEREVPDWQHYEQDKANIVRQNQDRKRNEVVQAWLKHLRQQAKVIEHPGLAEPRGLGAT